MTTSDPETNLPWIFAVDLLQVIQLDEMTADKLRKEWGSNETGFVARNALAILVRRGEPAKVVKFLAEFWRVDRKDSEKVARKAAAKHKLALARFEAALERLRLTFGLPDEDWDKPEKAAEWRTKLATSPAEMDEPKQ